MGRKFLVLPEKPDLTQYESEHSLMNTVKRLTVIQEDTDKCLDVLKENIAGYFEYANTLVQLATKGQAKRIKENGWLDNLREWYFALFNQFIAIDRRYQGVDETFRNRVVGWLREIDAQNQLGIYSETNDKNHYEAFEDRIFTFLPDAAPKEEKKPEPAPAQKTENTRFRFVKSTTTFKDVGGLGEVKKDLAQLVDFMKRPEYYKSRGAILPPGVLFWGPPGTGKTHLARAVAGEAGVSFIATAATDFTASTWGKTPEYIKELFAQARNHAPCIIFIDEIDMLGMNRELDKANGLAHREHLNALLAEMDGFEQFDGVMIIAATNRLEDLDPALTRPGRFDNQYSIPLPDSVDDVEEIVKMYTKGKFLDSDLDIRSVATRLLGNSPAAIQSILNEACLIAIANNDGVIRDCDISDALVKKLIKGHVKDFQDISAEEREIVAYHEAGHALAAVIGGREVESVSILGTTSGAGGITVTAPLRKHLLRKSDFENQIRLTYGGRAAEEVIFGAEMITTGASADIRRATTLITDASANYGFDLLNSDNAVPVIKQTDAKKLADTVDKASVKYYQETVQLMQNNLDTLKEIANALLQNGRISGAMVQEIYNNKNMTVEIV